MADRDDALWRRVLPTQPATLPRLSQGAGWPSLTWRPVMSRLPADPDARLRYVWFLLPSVGTATTVLAYITCDALGWIGKYDVIAWYVGWGVAFAAWIALTVLVGAAGLLWRLIDRYLL